MYGTCVGHCGFGDTHAHVHIHMSDNSFGFVAWAGLADHIDKTPNCHSPADLPEPSALAHLCSQPASQPPASQPASQPIDIRIDAGHHGSRVIPHLHFGCDLAICSSACYVNMPKSYAAKLVIWCGLLRILSGFCMETTFLSIGWLSTPDELTYCCKFCCICVRFRRMNSLLFAE